MRLIFLIVGMLTACGVASASDPVQPRHTMVPTAFTGDDGLPQAGVTSILQARDGYLWVGTFGGLARFDGSAFKIFRDSPNQDSRDPEGTSRGGPSSNRVLTLYEDDQARLWVGTQDAGLSVFEQGAFRHLSMCDGTCQVSAILQAADRAIWIASSAGIYRFPPDAEHAVLFEPPSATGYDYLADGSDGRIYVGGHGGLDVVVGSRLRAIPLPGGSRKVRILKRDGEALLVGTEHRLYRYRPKDGTWTPLDVEQPGYASRDGDGRWWVSRGTWVLMRENEAGAWEEVSELSGIGITALFHDDEGNLWVGTSSKGLLRLRRPLFRQMSALQLESSEAGRAVIDDGHGGLWFGLSCGALRHWQHNGSMQTLPIRLGAGNDCVSSLSLDHAGVLWVGTAAGALVRIKEGELQRIAVWPGAQSVNIWQNGDGRYLVSVRRSSYLLDIGAEGRISRRQRIEALEGMRINRVVAAARGGRWFVGDQGVLRMVDGKIVEQWTPREGLSSRFARALYEDKAANVLWVGTYGGGLNRIQNGQVSRYTTSNGLSDDTVSCILADDRGRLWLGGNQGVSLLPTPGNAVAEIESVGYAANDGLVPSEVNGGASTSCHRDARGRLWFSMVEGFAVVDSAEVPDVRPAQLRPYIEQVGVSGTTQEITGSALTLQPFSRNLDIHYTAINLSRPRETRFRFRLSGFDRDWVEAGQNRSILYPTIPWGEHLFEVQARTAGGPWSPVPASLTIIHPQPWYLRPWIWTLATLMGLAVLVGSTQLEERQQRSKRDVAARWARSNARSMLPRAIRIRLWRAVRRGRPWRPAVSPPVARP
ncbi:MAG: ligand-binding sensor domain-containing protein [Lysobacter sp.]